ncbi:MAG: hypothetical protein M1814_003303 [Vezdaea aestivalis]|nr:MAG: hypothetical protein M1814_003303 [Vezdaea aestivalis]
MRKNVKKQLQYALKKVFKAPAKPVAPIAPNILTYEIKMEPLDGENWLTWIDDLETELCWLGEWSFLLGSCPCPDDEAEAKAWQERHVRLKGFLSKVLDRHTRNDLRKSLGPNATATAWYESLKRSYVDSSPLPLTLEYHRLLMNMRSADYKSIRLYGMAMNKAFDELQKLGHEHDNLFRVITFLNGLSPEWRMFQSNYRYELYRIENHGRTRWPSLQTVVLDAQRSPYSPERHH